MKRGYCQSVSLHTQTHRGSPLNLHDTHFTTTFRVIIWFRWFKIKINNNEKCSASESCKKGSFFKDEIIDLLLLNAVRKLESGLLQELALFDIKNNEEKSTPSLANLVVTNLHVEQQRQRLTSLRCSALPHDAERLWLPLPLLLWDLSDHESGVWEE